MMPDMAFSVGSARLEAGDGLLAFTDGVTDARGVDGFFGDERLLALLREDAAPASALLDAIESAVLAHAAGWEQADDITLLAVRRT
jgi:sigma-B regulation protein RsbU (phosphoserine phosphatase)